MVFVTQKSSAAEVNIINTLGNLVYKKQLSFIEGKNQLSMPVQAYASDNYFMRVS